MPRARKRARPLSASRRKAMNRRKKKSKTTRGGQRPAGARRDYGRPYKRLPSFGKTDNMGLALVGGYSRGGVMPARNTARMTIYESDALSIAAASANLTIAQVRMDGLFDPFTAPASATKPRGFDEWMFLYSQYRVNRCKITVTVTFAAGSAAELQDIDNNMLLRYSVGATATVPDVTDTLKEMYERRQDRLVRFGLSEVKGKKISKTFTIDPWTLVKAGAIRFNPNRSSGWAEAGANPVYETGAIPTFFCQLHATQASFPTAVEVFVEVRAVYTVDFKNPELLAAS